jgi:hypothetical protein
MCLVSITSSVRNGGYSPHPVGITHHEVTARCKEAERCNGAEPQNASSTRASLQRSTSSSIKILAEPLGRSRSISAARLNRRQRRVMPPFPTFAPMVSNGSVGRVAGVPICLVIDAFAPIPAVRGAAIELAGSTPSELHCWNATEQLRRLRSGHLHSTSAHADISARAWQLSVPGLPW